MAPTDVTTTTARLLAGQAERGGRLGLRDHLSVHGPLPPVTRRGPWADQLIRAVEQAGLTGRGGAGFPTARKLAATRASRGRPLVIVNATEGEPASRKDRLLVALVPHLVLDGAEVAARIVGAGHIVVCVADDRWDSVRSLQSALAERAAGGLASVSTEVLTTPSRYITGEESALVSWVGGGRALPTFRLSKDVRPKVGRQPALVQNAETLAHLALIARYGPGWFRSAGREDAPGTCLVTVTGAVSRPGVQEVPLGTPVSAIVGTAVPLGEPGAVLTGGYGGVWLHPARIHTPFDAASLRAVGATTGAGVLCVLAADACGLAETTRIVSYMAGQTAGQCAPCVFGLPALAEDLFSLTYRPWDRGVFNRLEGRLASIDGRGACRHPDGVVRLVRSAFEVFGEEVEGHRRGSPCQSRKRQTVLPFPAGNGSGGS